jgi:hypothetical protein
MALHNAEVAGQEAARSGGAVEDNPHAGKKLRGALAGLFHAWRRGFMEHLRDHGPSSLTKDKP